MMEKIILVPCAICNHTQGVQPLLPIDLSYPITVIAVAPTPTGLKNQAIKSYLCEPHYKQALPAQVTTIKEDEQ